MKELRFAIVTMIAVLLLIGAAFGWVWVTQRKWEVAPVDVSCPGDSRCPGADR